MVAAAMLSVMRKWAASNEGDGKIKIETTYRVVANRVPVTTGHVLFTLKVSHINPPGW